MKLLPSAFLLSLFLVGCQKNETASNDAASKVAVSNYPLYYFAERLAGDL